ncbi:MAG: hypothetical protein ACR2QZ_07645 [Woeseiaceae bacterium]
MADSNDALREAVREAQRRAESTPGPDFSTVWAAASARAGSARKRYWMMAGSAAVIALVAITFELRAPSDTEWHYVDEYELLETTGWSAPSDSLLPSHEFDIYQSLPVLIESTEIYGGALL